MQSENDKPKEVIQFSCQRIAQNSSQVSGRMTCLSAEESIATASATDMICISSIPNSISRNDLIKYLSAHIKNILHIQFFYNDNIYLYMALLKFKHISNSMDFFRENHKSFLNELLQMSSNIYMIDSIEIIGKSLTELAINALSTDLACSICFEFLCGGDSTIFTPICNHSFHLSCISEWKYDGCPNCRQNQIPEEFPENLCQECHYNSGLWLCMTCGHIGCNRYLGHHALNHYMQTDHIYAMEIGTEKVWNYLCDDYVHRLVQGYVDNKMIEVDCSVNDMDTKLDALSLEYSCMIIKELNNQRKYYENAIEDMKRSHENEIKDILGEHKKQQSSNKEPSPTVKNLQKKLKNQDKKYKKLLNESTDNQRIYKLSDKTNNDLIEEMEKRIMYLEKYVDIKDKTIEALEEQLKEAYLNIETQQIISRVDKGETKSSGDSTIKINLTQ